MKVTIMQLNGFHLQLNVHANPERGYKILFHTKLEYL